MDLSVGFYMKQFFLFLTCWQLFLHLENSIEPSHDFSKARLWFFHILDLVASSIYFKPNQKQIIIFHSFQNL